MTRPKNGHIWSDISGSTGPIFAIFTPYERALRADDGYVAYFHLSRDVAMATDFVQKWDKIAYPHVLIALAIRNGMGYR